MVTSALLRDQLRKRILQEIKQLAEAGGGKPPGYKAFSRQTGISQSDWNGVLWSRWGDALTEAGYEPNQLQSRFDTLQLIHALVQAFRHYGHIPSVSEMKLYRIGHPSFPSKGAIAGHFKRRIDMLKAIEKFSSENEGFNDIVDMLNSDKLTAAKEHALLPESSNAKLPDGHVYLLKSGQYYKIGRSDELERRIKEIRVSMPESIVLIHAISTDDPPGIEAYWHRRFAHKRANGEWFKLLPSDVAAFKRRKFQ